MNEALQHEITELKKAKAEHAVLLRQINSDRGMDPRVRETLVEHIHEEEAERVAKIAQLGGQVAQPTPARSALTVGSLRPIIRPSGTGSVGSLRPSAPMSPGGSVGSLRG